MRVCFEVVHAVRGRVRLRVPAIKDNACLADSLMCRLLARPGVTSVRANSACASVVVGYDTAVLHTFIPEQHLKGVTLEETQGRTVVASRTDGNGGGGLLSRTWGFLRKLTTLLVPTAAFALSLVRRALPAAPVYALVCAAAAPIFRRAALTAGREKRLGVDFLDATAITIMLAQRNPPTCALMAWLISVGEHIRQETARRSQKAIADLIELHTDTAIIMRGGRRVEVAVERLCPGDRVVVCAGDVIPVDGTVVKGRAGVDQKSLTGESELLEKSPGDLVFAGTIAADGELTIRAGAIGLDTRAGKIVRMLRAVPVNDSKIEDYAARFADRLVIPTFATSSAVLALSGSVARALSVIIVDFGTGVRVAAPTAFLSHMACAAQKNIVIKGGRAMEKLASVDTVVLDKTGTLTTGMPEIDEVIPLAPAFPASRSLRLAAAAEAGLNHPVAKALVAKAAQLGAPLPEKDAARLRVGLGVEARVEGNTVLVGGDTLMERERVDIGPTRRFARAWENGATSPLYVAVDGEITCVITYSDSIRPESAQVVADLRELGVENVIMMTGDREEVARVTSSQLGIRRFISQVLPEEKAEILRELQNDGLTVAVVGDGINDSLALAHADVAVAPAGAADAAKEASDVLLMEDDLGLLVDAVAISKSAVQLVRQNFGIVAAPNALAIALAVGGLLGPSGATFINNGSTVAAALNGLRPLLANGWNGRGATASTGSSSP